MQRIQIIIREKPEKAGSPLKSTCKPGVSQESLFSRRILNSLRMLIIKENDVETMCTNNARNLLECFESRRLQGIQQNDCNSEECWNP
jgi:hypothetical protein